MKRSIHDEELLADYLEGRLSEKERSEREQHLTECQTCLEDLIVTSNIVRGGEGPEVNPVPSRVTQAAVHLVNRESLLIPPDSLWERTRQSIKGLYARLSDPFRAAFQGEWGLAPIRGARRFVSKDLIHIRKTFKEVETDIEIEKTGDHKAHIRISLPKADIERGIRVTLTRGEREISSHPLNDGPTLFEEIPFGHYGLTFARDGVKLGTYFFEIKESSNG
ncbi:MAG: hypothetical protein ABIG67_00930 [Pseudomonadota bacterium]